MRGDYDGLPEIERDDRRLPTVTTRPSVKQHNHATLRRRGVDHFLDRDIGMAVASSPPQDGNRLCH